MDFQPDKQPVALSMQSRTLQCLSLLGLLCVLVDAQTYEPLLDAHLGVKVGGAACKLGLQLLLLLHITQAELVVFALCSLLTRVISLGLATVRARSPSMIQIPA